MGDMIKFTFWKACSGFTMKEKGRGKTGGETVWKPLQSSDRGESGLC